MARRLSKAQQLGKDAKGLGEFVADLDAIGELLGVAVGVVKRRVAISAWNKVIMKSPVDTGRFRASWQMEEGEPSGAVEPEGKDSYPPPAMPQISDDPFGKISISNNLPYGPALEFGHSGQAPNGIVRITMAELETELEQIKRQAIGEVLE